MEQTRTRQASMPVRRSTTMIAIVAALLTLLAAAGSSASAQPRPHIDAAIQDISYDGLGTTTLRRALSGSVFHPMVASQGYLLRTTQLHASGTVACQGCGALNGASVTINQELAIVIVGDVLSPVIRGKTHGDIELGFNNVTLKKGFSGRLSAPSVDVSTCTSPSGCQLSLAIDSIATRSIERASVSTTPGSMPEPLLDILDPVVGSLEIELTATLRIDDGVPSWTSITGSGVARIVIDIIGAG